MSGKTPGQYGTVDEPVPREIMLGPVPCKECHARLYYVGGKWREMTYRPGRKTGQSFHDGASGVVAIPHRSTVRTYTPHTCTARSPFPAPGQYVGLASPRISGRGCGNGGGYRRLLGEAR